MPQVIPTGASTLSAQPSPELTWRLRILKNVNRIEMVCLDEMVPTDGTAVHGTHGRPGPGPGSVPASVCSSRGRLSRGPGWISKDSLCWGSPRGCGDELGPAGEPGRAGGDGGPASVVRAVLGEESHSRGQGGLSSTRSCGFNCHLESPGLVEGSACGARARAERGRSRTIRAPRPARLLPPEAEGAGPAKATDRALARTVTRVHPARARGDGGSGTPQVRAPPPQGGLDRRRGQHSEVRWWPRGEGEPRRRVPVTASPKHPGSGTACGG